MEIIGDLIGWVLLCFSFFVIILFRDIRNDFRMVFVIWFLLAIHHVIAIINAFIFTVKGAEGDASSFHYMATDWADHGEWLFVVGGEFYVQFLGFLYRVLGPSHFLGEELSVLAFSLSMILFVKLIRLLDLNRHRIALIFLYGAMPSIIIFSSVTLRESWQMLFFIYTVYNGILFRLYGEKKYLLMTLLSCGALGLFHNGLLVYSFFLIPFVLLWPMDEKKRKGMYFSLSKKWLSGLTVSIVVLVSLPTQFEFRGGAVALTRLFEGTGLDYVEVYRERSTSLDARATYNVTLDTSSLSGFATSVGFIMGYYLFSPFPWQVNTVLDLFAAGESLLRLILILFSIRLWRKSSGFQRKVFGFLLILYFTMTILWAAGTTNYGTAIRHHMVNYWIIALIGGSGLSIFVSRVSRTMLNQPVNGPISRSTP